MNTITITIPGNKVEEIIRSAYFKKMTGNWFPEGDPADWLFLQVILAAQPITPADVANYSVKGEK